MTTDQCLSSIETKYLSEKVVSSLYPDQPQSLLITDIILLIQVETGIESVGLRLQDGVDYPYYYNRGFPYDFIQKENYLCAVNTQGEIIKDKNGDACLECMCGNVIRGRIDPKLPFFTVGGSFWTNSTTELLATTSESDRQTTTRNRCNKAGYESVALIPIKNLGNIYGLIQLNDHRKNMFTEKFICLVESIAIKIAPLFIDIKDREHKKDLAESFWAIGLG